MEKAIIIALVLASALLLTRRILRIIKKYDSFCSGCGNSNGGRLCSCNMNKSVAKIKTGTIA
jgi:hypothetical protein